MADECASNNLCFSPEECVMLAALVDQELKDVHEELRRTENFEFQAKLHERDRLLHGLKEKFQPTVHA